MRRPLPLGRRTGRAGTRAARNSPDTAVMGPGRSQPARTPPGRPSGDVRLAAAVFRHRHGGTPSRLSRGDRHAASRTLQLREQPGCAGANLTGTKRGGAGASVRGSVVQLCVDLPCSRLPRANVVRHLELWPLSQTGMIEVLTMARQYSPQKRFRFLARNIRETGRAGRRTPGAAVDGSCGAARVRHCLWTDR